MELVIFFPRSCFAPYLFRCVLALTIPGILFCSSLMLLQLLLGWWGSGRCYLQAGVKLQQSGNYLTCNQPFPRGWLPCGVGCMNHLPGADLIPSWWQTCCFLRAAGAHHLTCRQCLTASPGMSCAASAASAALSSGSSFPPQLNGMPGSFVTCNLNLVSLSSARISFSSGHLNGVQSN